MRSVRMNFYLIELLALDRKHRESLDVIHSALVAGSNRIQVARERLAAELKRP